MHCAAHVIVIIIIAIVVINMIMNHALLVTKLLSVSVVQDEAVHRWSQLFSGHDISESLVGQCDAGRSLAQTESAVPRSTISQKVSSVNVMQDEALHRRSQLSLGPRYLRKSRRSM